MANIPAKVAQRLAAGIKRFQPVLNDAKSRDIGEADTVTIVTDMLADVFGYDKYSEITSEFAIKGTYCDLGTKIDGKLQALIEVKAIGHELKEAHVKQAVDYAANQGVEWVMLTNGIVWRIFQITFTKPIGQEQVVEIEFPEIDAKSDDDVQSLFLFCKEGWTKSALDEYAAQQQALSRFFLGAILMTEPVLKVIRRTLKQVSPDVRIDIDQIRNALSTEVVKREVMEGEKAAKASRKVARAASKALAAKSSKPDAKDADEEESADGSE